MYKTFTTALAGVGNAPLLVAGATTFPPAGGLYSSLCVEWRDCFAELYSAPVHILHRMCKSVKVGP